jgi:hypothetical protein
MSTVNKPVAVNTSGKAATATATAAKPVAAKSATASAAVVATNGDATPKQGRSIVLPNGQKRADYIRGRFAEGVKRGDIMREVNTMLEEAGRGEEKIPYQIVFAATKPKKEAEAAVE